MNMRLVLEWFVHPSRKTDTLDYKKSLLLIRVCLLTSIFSFSYVWLSIYFAFQIAANLMIFNVVGFLILPIFVRTKISIQILGHVYILFGAIAVITTTCFSGGIWSAVYPWIISIPVLALLVVDRTAGLVWGLISFVSMLVIGGLSLKGYEFPVGYNKEMKTEWFISVLPGLLLIVMLVSLVFESSQKKALDSLAAQNEQLKSQKDTIEKQASDMKLLLEEKDQMIRIMAHDLKNPLANILSISEMLKEDRSTNERDELTDLIEKISGKSIGLIDKVLDMIVSEQQGILVKKEKLDLISILSEAVDELGKQAQRKKIAVILDTEVPSFQVDSDPTYLLLVFENLLSNAIKFSGMETTVTLSVNELENSVTIRVSDQGPGIKPEEEHLLFKKFSKLSARPTFGENSTGIGLSLVSVYLDKLGGSIRLEQTEEKGATFVVELPST